MVPQTWIKRPAVLMSAGMLCLSLAIAWPQFIRIGTDMGADRIDGVRGFLFGVAIGLNIWSLMARARLRGANRSARGGTA